MESPECANALARVTADAVPSPSPRKGYTHDRVGRLESEPLLSSCCVVQDQIDRLFGGPTTGAVTHDQVTDDAAAAAISIAASFALTSSSASAQDLLPERHSDDVNACVGMTCAPAHGVHGVPEAQGAGTRVAGPADLHKQLQPGFYEFGDGTLIRTTAVAYVIPKGHGKAAPPSIQRLPSYQRLASMNAFERGTSVIFSAGVSEFAQEDQVFGILGYNDCGGGLTCIWEDRDYGGRMLQFSDTGSWQNLGNYGFNDNADSIANKRPADSLLAEHTGGGGDRSCFDSYSASSSLGGFGDDASSIYLSTSDGRC